MSGAGGRQGHVGSHARRWPPPWLAGVDRWLASGFVGDRQRWAAQLREVAEPEPEPEPAWVTVARAAGLRRVAP